MLILLNILRAKQDMENPMSSWTSRNYSIDYHIKVATNVFDHDLDRLASLTKNNQFFRHCTSLYLSSYITNYTPLYLSNNISYAIQQLAADVMQHHIDAVVLSETWLKAHHQDAIVNIPGYTLFRRDQKRRRGGAWLFSSETIFRATY